MSGSGIRPLRRRPLLPFVGRTLRVVNHAKRKSNKPWAKRNNRQSVAAENIFLGGKKKSCPWGYKNVLPWKILNPKHKKMKKNVFFCHFFSFTPMFWEFNVVILQRIWKTRLFNSKIYTLMEKNVLSLVMDTLGLIGMFFIAAVLLCI